MKNLNPWLYRLLAFLGLVIVLFLVTEGFLRIMGYQPANNTVKLKIEPENTFIQPDSLLGYVAQPGQLTITINDSLTFTCTNLENGFRTSGPQPNVDTFPEIWFLGCSFTYGWGVNDEDTYCYKLQQQFPEYTIKNYGMGAYSTVQSYLLLKQLLESGKRPKAVYYAYSDLHDERNVSGYLWRKNLQTYSKLGELNQPYVRWKGNNRIQFKYYQIENHRINPAKYSAAFNWLDMNYNDALLTIYRTEAITFSLMSRMYSLCLDNKIPFYVINIVDYIPNYPKNDEWNEIITNKDIYIDLSQPGMSNWPYDGHPSAEAHSIYAEKIAKLILSLDNK